MKINELFSQKKTVVSFEVFPPKPDSPFETVLEAVEALHVLKPDFITKKIALFLFIINGLDFVFLGLMDNLFYLLKIPLSFMIFAYANNKISFQRT